MELHLPDQVAYVNVNNNTTTKTSRYQDLHLRTQENTGQYQELVTKQERQSKMDTSAKNSQVRGQATDCKTCRCRPNNMYNWLASCLIISIDNQHLSIDCFLQPVSNLGLLPDGMAYENIKKNRTREATSQYQDVDLRTPENTVQYLELVKEPETSVKIVSNNLEITYENTKMEGQNKSGTKSQPEQSQYEELNTGNERNDEHPYSEVSRR